MNTNNFVTKPSLLDTQQNQIKNLTSLNNENNKNIGNVNLTSVSHNFITSNINKTQITGITMKNNFIKNNLNNQSENIYNNELKNTKNNINKSKIKYNINNHTHNRISEHWEESRKYDSIKSKVNSNKINSKSFSKNKTNNNSKINLAKEDNLDTKNLLTGKSGEKPKEIIKKNSLNKKNDNFIKKNNPNLRIVTNENIGTFNSNVITSNQNIRTSNSKKKEILRLSSKEKLVNDNCNNKENNLAEFILNNVEPLKINDFKYDLNKTEKFNDIEKLKKINHDEPYNNINSANIRMKKKNSNNNVGNKNNNKSNGINQNPQKNQSQTKNLKKNEKRIKIDIRELLSEEEENELKKPSIKHKEEFHIYQKYKKPATNATKSLRNLDAHKILLDEKNKSDHYMKIRDAYNSEIKSNLYANTEENNLGKDIMDNSLRNLKELYENPNSKTRLSQNKPLKNIKLTDHVNKIKKKKNNFRRLKFDDNPNISDLLEELEKKEKKLNNVNANTQNIINLKDCIMKLDIPKYNIDLKPLEYDLPYNEILKHFKENNKFLFEMTNEEKELNDKLKAFNYVSFDETITDTININQTDKKLNEELNRNKNKEGINSSKITNSIEADLNSTKKFRLKLIK